MGTFPLATTSTVPEAVKWMPLQGDENDKTSRQNTLLQI